MLTFLREREFLWDRLARTGRPLVLYGTGDGADKIRDRLARIGRAVDAVYVSDDHARGQTYAGLPVRPVSELLAQAGRQALDWPSGVPASGSAPADAPLVLVAFASERPAVLATIRSVAAAWETYAPHVPLFLGETALDAAWLAAHEAELQYVYDHLADDKSRQVFADILDYKISGRLSWLWDAETRRDEDLRALFSFRDGASCADLGAYDGDTAREFLALLAERGIAPGDLYAVEADPKNYAKLRAWVDTAPTSARLHCVHAAVGAAPGRVLFPAGGGRQSSLLAGGGKGRRRRPKETEVAVESLDHLLGLARVDYAKLDVEGVEAEALRGMKDHLVPDGDGRLPQLLVAAYHHDDDLFRLPLLLWRLQPAYRVYLRKHPYVPAWELNFFCR